MPWLAERRANPMIDCRPLAALGGANHGWLDAKRHLVFAGNYDQARMGWDPIRVWNDDMIEPGTGAASTIIIPFLLVFSIEKSLNRNGVAIRARFNEITRQSPKRKVMKGWTPERRPRRNAASA